MVHLLVALVDWSHVHRRFDLPLVVPADVDIREKFRHEKDHKVEVQGHLKETKCLLPPQPDCFH